MELERRPIRHPLALLRAERGWSQEDLGARLRQAAAARGLRSGIRRQRVWEWETHGRRPSPESQRLIADIFGIGEIHGPWPTWLPTRTQPLPLGPGSALHALREALNAMERRTFALYSSAGLIGLAQQWAVLEPERLHGALHGRRLDTPLLDWLETTAGQLTTLPTADRQHTRTLLHAHRQTVEQLLRTARYDGPAEARLHRLAARVGTTTGWYAFDQGDQGAASRAWHAALHSAHAAGDRDLGAGVLADLSYQSLWLDDAATAAHIIDHALAHTSHPTSRSLLHLRRARAHARTGNARACHRDLAAAETHLDAAGPTAPPWCAWMSSADLAVDAGRCLLDLGRTGEAHTRIAEGLRELPAARAKTQAVFLAYEADAHLSAGDVEEAADTTRRSYHLAQGLGADRCVGLIRDPLPRMRQHPHVPGVPELLTEAA